MPIPTSKTVSPTHVRDLYGTMQHEGATLGIMITTSGYGPGSVEFANGKPLHLIDGTGLLSICQENGIPARILDLGKRKPSKPLPRNSRLDDHVDCCFWLEFGQL